MRCSSGCLFTLRLPQVHCCALSLCYLGAEMINISSGWAINYFNTHQASLRLSLSGSSIKLKLVGASFLCTAAIISSRHVITASSCIGRGCDKPPNWGCDKPPVLCSTVQVINHAITALSCVGDGANPIEGRGLSIVAGEHNLFEQDHGQMR